MNYFTTTCYAIEKLSNFALQATKIFNEIEARLFKNKDLDEKVSSSSLTILSPTNISLGIRTGLLVMSGAEIAFINSRATESLEKLKNREITLRMIGLPFEMLSGLSEILQVRAQKPAMYWDKGIQVVYEKRLFLPITSLFRARAERNFARGETTESKLRAWLLAEFIQELGINARSSQYIRGEPVDRLLQSPIDTQENLHLRESVEGHREAVLALVMMAAEARIETAKAKQLLAEGTQAENNANFSLVDAKEIPEWLEEDPVLRQHICVITQRPIRHPVADPTTERRTLYDKNAIKAWLREQERSPASSSPLKEEDLVPCPEIQKLIDDRLALYQQLIEEEMKNRDLPTLREEMSEAQNRDLGYTPEWVSE